MGVVEDGILVGIDDVGVKVSREYEGIDDEGTDEGTDDVGASVAASILPCSNG